LSAPSGVRLHRRGPRTRGGPALRGHRFQQRGDDRHAGGRHRPGACGGRARAARAVLLPAADRRRPGNPRPRRGATRSARRRAAPDRLHQVHPTQPEHPRRLTEGDGGGGFGVRGELYPEDILVPLAAMKLGRPVKWIESRRENLMAANHAREVAYEIEISFDRDGRILGIRTVIHADIGAYVRTAALVPAEFGAALLPGPYRVPNYACDLWSVVTNKTPAGTLRSPGRPECNFVRERLLDQA